MACFSIMIMKNERFPVPYHRHLRHALHTTSATTNTLPVTRTMSLWAAALTAAA